MTRFSLPNVPATYSVSQETVLHFLTKWCAWRENVLLGFYDSRTLAEHAAKWDYSEALCTEEA